MAKPMSKAAVVKHLADRLDLAKKQVGQLLDELHALTVKEVRHARPGRNRLGGIE